MRARVPAPVVVILALTKFFLALWFGARGVARGESPPPAGALSSPAPSGAAAIPASDDTAVKALELEVSALAAKVIEAESKAPRPPTPEENAARGREIASMILQSYDELDGDARRKWRAAFLDLTPEMAPAFAAAFWELKGGSNLLAEILAASALQSGGPGACDFIEQLLRNGDEERVELLRDALFGVSEFGFPDAYPRLALSDAVAALAVADVTSPEINRRLVGVMLLRWRNTAESRAALQLAVESDSSGGVRERAIDALGTVGDAGTVEWLERYEATHTDDDAFVAGEAIRNIRERLTPAPPPNK